MSGREKLADNGKHRTWTCTDADENIFMQYLLSGAPDEAGDLSAQIVARGISKLITSSAEGEPFRIFVVLSYSCRRSGIHKKIPGEGVGVKWTWVPDVAELFEKTAADWKREGGAVQKFNMSHQGVREWPGRLTSAERLRARKRADERTAEAPSPSPDDAKRANGPDDAKRAKGERPAHPGGREDSLPLLHPRARYRPPSPPQRRAGSHALPLTHPPP